MLRPQAVAVVCALVLSSPAAAAGFPETVKYSGEATDLAGAPVAGRHTVEVAYFEGADRLMAERFEGVAFAGGKFEVALGRGLADASSAFPTLAELSAHHPRLELAFRIDGVEQSPRVKMLPAGHSAETRAILAGAASANDSAMRSKGYRPRSGATAIQAATLRPGAAGPTAWESPAPEFQRGAMQVPMDGPYLSPALRDTPAADPTPRAFQEREINPPRHESLVDENGVPFGTAGDTIVDPLAGASLAPAGIPSPAPLLNFEGVPNIQGFYPPDTEGVAGPNHYAQVTNVEFAIFDKSGVMLPGFPKETSELFTGFPGTTHQCETSNDGDAIFLYDRHAGRWVLTQFAISGSETVCFAISATDDPTGVYYLYSLDTQRFPDYFKLGTWPDPANNAWFMGTNSGFQNQYDVYALDRENMLTGAVARPAQFFQSYYNLMMPADAEDMPPAGSPGLFYTFRDQGQSYFNNPPTDSLDIFAFDVDWTTPVNSTFGAINVLTPAAGGLAEFNWSVCGFFVSSCLNQPGTAVNLDSASWWPMKRLVYRNFAGQEALVGAWTVDVTGTPDLAGIRWFELRRTTPGPNWTIHQQGTWTNGEAGPTAAHRWMPSIAMDGDGGIAVGYSVMKDNAGVGDIFASIRYAVRSKDDPLGTLREEASMMVGTGYQTGSASRWGDYSAMNIDPVDDCTFWYTNEYLVTNGGAPWQTRIATFKIPGCGGLAVAPSKQTVCTEATSEVDYDVTVFAPTFVATTNLDFADCPSGATCGFSDDPIVNPDDDSVFTVSGLGSVAAGSYAIPVTATDSVNLALTRDTSVVLEVFTADAAVPALATPADGATGVDRKPVLTWGAAAQAVSYDLEVADDAGFSNIVYSETGLAATSHQLATPLDPLTVYYWRVRANNICGTAGYSAAFDFETQPIPKVLLVDDDDNSPNVQATYTSAVTLLSTFDVWDVVAEGSEPTTADLAPYELVIWFSGDRFTFSATPSAGPQAPAEAALATFLNSGGGRCVFISSQDYLFDMGGINGNVPTAFMQNYLGTGAAGNSSDDGNYTSVTGQNLFAGMGPFTLSYPFTDYSDILTASATGRSAFVGNNTNVGAVSKQHTASRGFYFSFPWEALSAPNRALVLQRLFDQCGSLIFSDGFESEDTSEWSDEAP